MKNIFTLLLSLFITFAHASNELEIHFSENKAKQGKIEKVELSFDEAFAQKIDLQKIKGQKLGDVFYLYSVGPIMRKSGNNNLTADAKVIVVSEPKGTDLNVKVNEQEIQLKWNTFSFEKVEAPQGFLKANFDIPTRKNFLLFGGILVFFLLASWGVIKLRRRNLLKSKQRNEREKLKTLVLNATNYEEIVNVWKNKSVVLRVFPAMDEVFSELEIVLFKYQFKASQTESEKEEVSKAYRDFCLKAQGVMSGV